MSDLKIVSESADTSLAEPVRAALPVPASEASFTRRDLDLIKRDLITVRKDYHEIRNNMVILTHQYSSAPSKAFFVLFGIVWLLLLAGLLVFQPQLTDLGGRLIAMIPHR